MTQHLYFSKALAAKIAEKSREERKEELLLAFPLARAAFFLDLGG